MQTWWMVVAGPVLGGVGYLVRRSLEGRRRGETLKRRLQALALVQGMRRTGLTVSELDRLGEDR